MQQRRPNAAIKKERKKENTNYMSNYKVSVIEGPVGGSTCGVSSIFALISREEGSGAFVKGKHACWKLHVHLRVRGP